VKWKETEIETREWLIRHITRFLSLELAKVNNAFRFVRIETPIVVPFSVTGRHEVAIVLNSGQSMLRHSTLDGSYEASQELLRPESDIKFRLPLVIWQAGKVFRLEPFRELHTLEYHLLYSNKTGMDYRPILQRAADGVVQHHCPLVSSSAVTIQERPGFWAGKCLELFFDLDQIVVANLAPKM